MAKGYWVLARIYFSKKKKEKKMPCHVSFCSQTNWIDPSITVVPKKIIKIISVNRQYKQSECLFPPAMCWEYLESCTTRQTSFYLFPFIKTQQLLWFADTLNTNTTMLLLSLQDPPQHTHTQTHSYYHPPHPNTPLTSPLFPSSNTKLPVVAMATAGVHKSKRRGTLQSLKLSGGFFWGVRGAGSGGGECRGGGVIYGT